MGKLILFNMMTVDGYFEGEDQSLEWHHVVTEFNDFAIEQLNSSDILVFGRVTYELMAGYWPSKDALKNDPVVAEKMNSISKIIFTKTMDKATWINTRHFRDHPELVIVELKKNSTKNIYVFSSAYLSETFNRFKLFDEFRIMLNPIILGKGIPLFNNIPGQINLTLHQSRVFKSWNILLQYLPKY